MKNLLEECTLTIVSNDGDTALADVFVQGEKVDTASFEREEESVRDFCKSFPVGRVTQGKRAVSTEQEFERQAEKTKPSYGSENKEVNLDPKGSKSSPLESMVSAGKSIAQAIAAIAPGQVGQNHVIAVLKEVGYESGKINKPEKFAGIGSGKGQTQVKTLKKQQKDVGLKAKAKKSASEATGTAIIYTEDCLDFLKRFEKKSVDLLLTDPLYMTDVPDITKFAKEWLPVALSKLKDTGRGFVFIGAYPEELRAYLNTALPEQLLVWTYNNTIGPMPKKKHFQNWQAVLYYQGEKAADWNESQIKNVFSSQTHNAPDGRLGPKYYTWEKPIDLV